MPDIFTIFTTEYTEDSGLAKQTLTISTKGDVSVVPAKRTFKLRFKDIKDGDVCVYVNGHRAEIEEVLTDCAAVDVQIESGIEYCVEVSYKPVTRLEQLKAYACKTLICASGNIWDKDELWKQIDVIESEDDYIKLVKETSKVSETVKLCLKEIL